MIALIVVFLISYLVGSIPTSVWVGKLFFKTDIRNHGSGNAGATNTFRVLGWEAGLFVFLFDVGKGYVCGYWVAQLAFLIGSGPVSIPHWNIYAFLSITCGIVAVLGHMYPLYAKFDGGKGMATACGMLIAIAPISVGITFGVFVITLLTSHYVSLASLIAAFIYPLMLLILRYVFHWMIDPSVIIFGAIIGLGIIIKHKGNIRRLIAGTENKIALSFLTQEQAKPK